MYALNLDAIEQKRVSSHVIECLDLGYKGRWDLVLQDHVAHITYERGGISLAIEWNHAENFIERDSSGNIRVTRGGYGLQFKASAGTRMLWTWRQLQMAKRDPAYISKVRTFSKLKLAGGITAVVAAMMAGNGAFQLISTLAPGHSLYALLGVLAALLPGIWLIRHGLQDRQMANLMRQVSAAHFQVSQQRVMRRSDVLI